MAVTREEIIEALKEMSLLEASELVKDIEETFGVSAAAPVAVCELTKAVSRWGKKKTVGGEGSSSVRPAAGHLPPERKA